MAQKKPKKPRRKNTGFVIVGKSQPTDSANEALVTLLLHLAEKKLAKVG